MLSFSRQIPAVLRSLHSRDVVALSARRSFHSSLSLKSKDCGIVGMPNVGKSTLFNALTSTQNAEAANYPFCTIEPNHGIVSIPDKRLDIMADLAGSQKVIRAQTKFVDIAGLVRGASKGEGLGNQFLANIRNVTIILHVLRCFEHSEISHVEGHVDPIRDLECIDTELLLSDLQTVEKQLQKKNKKRDHETDLRQSILQLVQTTLSDGIPARNLIPTLNKEEVDVFDDLQLLSAKPTLFVCNVEEDSAARGNSLSAAVSATVGDDHMCVVSASIEEEVANLEVETEKREYLESYGLEDSGLSAIIRKSNALLGMQTFYTVGPQEARSWPIAVGTTAQQAGGKIHSDIERGFIRAETMSFDDFVALGGDEKKAQKTGKLRLEGKEYVCQDGDIFHFRFNV